MRRLTAFLFLATLATVTWEKVHWEVAGATLDFSEVFAVPFLVLFLVQRLDLRDFRMARVAAVAGVFATVFVLVYLIGFYNLQTTQALDQFGKGLVKFILHVAFFVAAIAYVSRRSERFYWRSLTWFFGGMIVNAAYGLAQLAAARAGHNLDDVLVSPLTHGASQINIYGAVQGSQVYRPNALSGDPNHLAIMLELPLLTLLPISVRLERGHRLRAPLGALIALLLLAELTTLSRSGLLGLGVGLLLLVPTYRSKLTSASVLGPVAAVAAVLLVYVVRHSSFVTTVLRSRIQTGHAAASPHFAVYDFIPKILHSHPLFGLGINNFSVYYEFVTGTANWGPHSFYVALMVESGVVGTITYALFLAFVFIRLSATRHLGRQLAAAGIRVAARVRPLSWGLTAAFVATLVANAFYLTMTFFYFYVFLGLALSAAPVFIRRLSAQAGSAVSSRAQVARG